MIWPRAQAGPFFVEDGPGFTFSGGPRETLIKPRSSLQGGLSLIHETAARDDSASLPL